MAAQQLIQDRGRGPEIVGTRITVYNLLTSFLDPTVTELEICRIYELTGEQVAAARAYVLSNPDTVLAEHLRIEERLAAGIEHQQSQTSAQAAKATFQKFKRWLAENNSRKTEGSSPGHSTSVPTFREWLVSQPDR
jgi:uncharacterized protein (DUF433 family)